MIPKTATGSVRFATRVVTRIVTSLALGFFCFFWLGQKALAENSRIFSNLSSHIIPVGFDFDGEKILLFGTVEQGSEIGIVIEGPNRPALAQRRHRKLGFWVNEKQVYFPRTPGFYASVSTLPLSQLAPPETLRLYQLGLPNLVLLPEEALSEGEALPWLSAFHRIRQRNGLYLLNLEEILRIGPQLFRAEIVLPGNAAIGMYTVRILLFRHGEVLDSQTIPFVVQKVGLGGMIADASRSYPALYGLLCIFLAGLFGWGTDFLFRRLF